MPLARGDTHAGLAFDQRLRAELAGQGLAALGFSLSYSAGMAKLMAYDQRLQQLVHRADKALYAAKAAGRGRLVHGNGSEGLPTQYPT